MSNTDNNTNSIAQQLAERRARLLQSRPNEQNEQNQSSTNVSDKMEEDDFEFAMQLQRKFDAEDNDDDNHNSHSDEAIINSPAANDSDIEILDDSNSNSANVIDKDHEIAMQLQRQFDNEESNVPPPSHSNPNYNQNAFSPQMGMHGNFGPFPSHSSSRNSNNGTTVITTRSGPSGQLIQTITTNHNNRNNMNTQQHMQQNPFDHPFFRQGMQGFNQPFFQQHNHNNNRNQNGNGNPFDHPFFTQNIGGNVPHGIPMMNMNMMDLMMGQDDGFHFFMPMAPRPQVANQENVDALPTDRYRAKSKTNHDIEEEEKQTHDRNESKKETCSICLEEFKNGEEIRRLPCLHIFHKNEIDRWLLTGADKCPICRVPINGQVQNQ